MPENTVNKLLIASIIILTFIFFVSFKVYLSDRNEFYDWDVKMLTDVKDSINKNKEYDLLKEINPLYKYHIFYINLDRSSDRNEMMINQLKNMFETNYTRISAIDGSKIKNKYKDSVNGDSFINEYENAISSAKNRKKRINKLSTSEIGCTLSHIKAIRKIYDNNLDYAIVMEDDCLLHLAPFWGFDLDYLISQAPKDWGIIQLHIFNKKCKIDDNIEKDGMFSELKLSTPCHSTAVYLINKKGVRDVLNVCGYSGDMKIKLQDFGGVADEYIYYLTRTYYTNIPMFLTADQQHKSTIHEKHSDYHISASNDVLQVYKNINDHSIYDNYFNENINLQYVMLSTLYNLNSFMQSINVNFYLDRETLLHLYREGKFLSSFNDICVSVLHSKLNKTKIDKIKSGNNKFSFVKSYGDANTNYIIVLKHNNFNKYVIIYFLYNNSTNSLSNLRGSSNINCIDNMNICTINYAPRTVINKIQLSQNKSFYCIGPIESHLRILYGDKWFISENLYANLKENNSEIQYIWPLKIKESYKPILWVYDDRVKEKINKVCIGKMLDKTKSFEMIVIDDINFENISRTYNKNFRNIEPREVRIEYIKCCILNEYGGVFVEYDTRFLTDIRFMIEDLLNYNVCYMETNDNKINNILLASKPNNRLYSKAKSLFEYNKDFNLWKTSKSVFSSVLNSDIMKEYIKSLKRYYPREILPYKEKNKFVEKCI